MVTNERLTQVALVVGIALLLVLGVNASVGTVQSLSGNQPTSSGLSWILGAAGTSVQFQPPQGLSTDGAGSVTLSPDEVEVTVGVLTQAQTAQSAAEANAATIGAVISSLNSVGIGNSNISTTSYSVSPVYNYTKSGSPVISGYQATHSLQITQQSSDLSALGSKASQIIDLAVGAGANQVNGVYFTLSDTLMKQSQNQALQLAIQDAASRAQLMASALGVTLAGVQSVTSTTGSTPVVNYLTTSRAPAAGGEVSTAVIPGNFTVTAAVQVSYGIK